MANVDDTGTDPAGSIPPPPPPGYQVPGSDGALPPGSSRRTMTPGRRRLVAVLATLGLLAVPAVVGYDLGKGNATSSSQAGVAVLPSSIGSSQTSQTQGSTSGQRSTTGIDASAIANKVDDSVVNITTTLSSGGEAAGTGIILSSSGLVLTNNHVIADSTSLQVEIGGNGSTHAAKVLGYDLADDVALIQVQNVSGLTAATLGDSSNLSVGDTIVALGNAGGKGGSPSVVTGSVTGLNQQITASDQDGSNAETLHDLVEVDADIQAGDSGGPLVNSSGQVVGMDAAASSSNGGFGFAGQSANQGYAIPIENVVAIAKKIASGGGGTNIHVGANRALLGVAVQADSTSSGNGSFGGNSGLGDGSSSSVSGALVSGVQSGSGAEKAGIAEGDVITSIGGKSIASATALTHAMTAYSPKDTVDVTWTDSSGSNHHASIELGSGPPA